MNWWSKLLCRCRSRTWSASAWSMIIGMFWGQLFGLMVIVIVIVIVLSIIDIILHRHVLRTTLGHPPTTLLLTFLLHHSFPAIIAFPGKSCLNWWQQWFRLWPGEAKYIMICLSRWLQLILVRLPGHVCHPHEGHQTTGGKAVLLVPD